MTATIKRITGLDRKTPLPVKLAGDREPRRDANWNPPFAYHPLPYPFDPVLNDSDD